MENKKEKRGEKKNNHCFQGLIGCAKRGHSRAILQTLYTSHSSNIVLRIVDSACPVPLRQYTNMLSNGGW